MNNICIKLFSRFHLYTLAQITFLKAISTRTLIVILKPSINHKIKSFQRPFQRLCVTQKLFTKTIAKPVTTLYIKLIVVYKNAKKWYNTPYARIHRDKKCKCSQPQKCFPQNNKK